MKSFITKTFSFFIFVILFLIFTPTAVEANAPRITGRIYVSGTDTDISTNGLSLWLRMTDSTGGVRYNRAHAYDGHYTFYGWQEPTPDGLPETWPENMYNTWIVPDHPEYSARTTNYAGYADESAANAAGWVRQANRVNRAGCDECLGPTFGFGCGETPLTISVIKPHNWEGSFSSFSINLGQADINGTPYSNNFYTYYAEPIYYTPPPPPPPPPPPSPSGSCPNPGTTGTAAWGASSGATYYNLRVDNLANGWGGCNSQPGDFCVDNYTSTSYNFNTSPNTNYRFWVHAIGPGGDSGPVYSNNFTCIQPVPTAPTIAGSCRVPGTQGTISWSAVSTATSYKIRVDDRSNGWSGRCDTLNSGDSCDEITGTTYNFPTRSGRSYNVWINAVNSSGNSPESNTETLVCNAYALGGYCTGTQSTANGSITWRAEPTGGNYGYTYSWSGAVSGTAREVYTGYVSGSQTATVNITSNDGQGPYTTSCSIYPPGPVAFTQYSAQCNGIAPRSYLTWNFAENATRYILYRQTPGGASTELASISGSQNYYYDTAISESTNYRYYLYAVNDNGSYYSSYTGWTSYVTSNQCYFPPSPPTVSGSAACSASGTTAPTTITWSSTINTNYYDIWRLDYSNLSAGYVYLGQRALNNRSFTDSNPPRGRNYYYVVQSVGNDSPPGEGGVQVYVPLCTPRAFSVSTAASCQNNASRVNISWTNSTYAQYYNVFAFREGVAGWQFIGSTSGNSISHYPAISDQNYNYEVDAINEPDGIYSAYGPRRTLSCYPINLTCVSSPNRQVVTYGVDWTANATGGNGNYNSYRWSGGTIGSRNGRNVNNVTYPNPGTYTEYCSATDTLGNTGSGSGTVTILSKPDLRPDGPLTNPSTMTVLSDVRFSGGVVNYGGTGAGVSQTRFCIDNSNCTGNNAAGRTGRVGNDVSTPAVAANGGNQYVQTTTTWRADVNHSATICVDVENAVDESDETNNCRTIPLTVENIDPYVQTQGGDVHSNTEINTPGGPP